MQEEITRFKNWQTSNIIFAQPLYDMHDACRKVLTDAGIKIPAHLQKKDGNLLQWLGSDWGRNTFGESVWADVVKGKMSQLQYEGRMTVIVSDCRFENEFNAFPDALRVRLECPEELRKTRAEMWRPNTQHISEINLDGYAAAGKFDLTLNTDKVSVGGCVDLIMAQLLKQTWREKRAV